MDVPKKSDVSEVDMRDTGEGYKNPLASSKILSPLMPPKRGGSSTSLSKLSSAVMIPGLNRYTKRQNELYSEVWKLLSPSSTGVPALLPCAMLPRQARGTHKKQLKNYCTVHSVS